MNCNLAGRNELNITASRHRKALFVILLLMTSSVWAQPRAGDQVKSQGLLIDDQEEATERMPQMRQGQDKRTSAFTYANYYRFFPDMINQDDRDWQGQVQVPQAGGFDVTENQWP